MSSHSTWSWEEMIAAFRQLGGTIDNIRLGKGPRGRGLFAIDNTKPIQVRLPENLLFPSDDVEFAGDRIHLKASAFVGPEEREFFDSYQESFSWGAGGQAECVSFIAALDGLPEDIRKLLANDFGMARRFEGDVVERAGRQFLASRQIDWKGQSVIMPIIELANNEAGALEYQLGEDLSLEGTVADEVLVSYGAHDPFWLFFNYGYCGAGAGAFSLPMKLKVPPSQISIDYDTDRSERRGNYIVPVLAREDSRISLSYLMLGLAAYPSAPRGIFRALTKEIFGENTDEVFDAVRQFNNRKFIRLLAALESFDGPMIAKLARVARFQLDAISWSIGSLDLNDPVPPQWRETRRLRAQQAPGSDWTWERMLEDFRELGGVAENIRLAYGPSGRGIFTVDRDAPFRLRVPQNLLFPTTDIQFVDGRIGIRADAPAGTREREFFARYQETFSWGGGGSAESAEFVRALQELPPDVREVLSAQFSMGDVFEGDAEIWTRRHFLQHTGIEWKGRTVLAPVLELTNHRPDATPNIGDDFLEIAGTGGDQVFISRRPADAFEAFRRYGFASPEPAAFGMTMKTKVGRFDLVIERNIPPHIARANFATPQIWRDENRLVMSWLPLGHQEFPRMSRGTFRALLRSPDVTVDEADEAFDRILHFNRMKFVKLLEALAPHDGRLVGTLRKMGGFQLEAMSWCIGSREV